MRVLWVCNTMLPVVAAHFGLEASNKEGWLSGLCNVVMENQKENGIELYLSFPMMKDMHIWGEKVPVGQGVVVCYGFREDTSKPEQYDATLETELNSIAQEVNPDVIHCFGTEYPHTCAICETYPYKDRLLIGIQGLCAVYANAYFADLPQRVIGRVTFRDFLKKDSITKQREKFIKRGEMEIRAVKAAGNVTGRTPWDKHYTGEWNPDATYYSMNETLRPEFYEDEWKEECCIPHSIFLSQGDYPIKGLHYMLLALPAIKECYPDVKVYVAGNSIANYSTLKDKIKISSYGKYIRELIKQGGLEENVVFMGRLNAKQMKEAYLKSHLFVCCSAIENSPNSLGEAMLLGMPCVSADMGGVSGIFTGGEDGIFYEGFKTSANSYDNMCYGDKIHEYSLQKNVKALSDAVIDMWSDKEKMQKYCKNARLHARKTHNREQNYYNLQEIYASIADANQNRQV